MPPAPPRESEALPPVRFLLTFDDGPSADVDDNPTVKIADTLASNRIQPGIKALFFVQTRWTGAGGSLLGRSLMRRLAAQGHLLGLHSGSVRGHVDHTAMRQAELEATLRTGIADIAAVSGETPQLVRPTYWEFNAATLAMYRNAGLHPVLTDLSARDGSLPLFQVDPDSGGRLNCDLACFRQRLYNKRVPLLNGVAPVLVAFHDINRYTAEHMPDYLAALLRGARRNGLAIADPPFYTEHAALRQAARMRAGTYPRWRNSIVRQCGE
ncbi:MAG: polysaccharide deacetylase family protein [Gammaproteobacteria bacterium]